MTIFGIEFAPLSLPFERRLQTLGVLYFVLSFFVIGQLTIVLLGYLLFTRYYWITILYLSWIYLDRNTCSRGGRRVEWARRWAIWRHFTNYFPIKLVKTVDLPLNQNYIFGCHPHGILCFSHFANFGTEGTKFSETFPGITPYLATLNYQFYNPFHRDIFMMSGAISADRESIEYVLRENGTGNAVAIMIGGAREVLDIIPNTMILTLNRRKGFIKLALKHGAALVPVIAFGENELYKTGHKEEDTTFKRFQAKILKLLTFSFPVFFGRGIFQYSFGWLPFRRPVTTVVGKPIPIEKNDNPTNEQIDEIHERYVRELTELYDKHKNQYGHGNIQLKIK